MRHNVLSTAATPSVVYISRNGQDAALTDCTRSHFLHFAPSTISQHYMTERYELGYDSVRRCAHLNMVNALCSTFAIPHHLTYSHVSEKPGMTYLSSSTVMLPASPPAMSAKPRKRNNLAFHAAPSYEEVDAKPPSSDSSLCLSMRLTMIIPSVLNMGASQSVKPTRTGTVSYGASAGGCALAERRQASKKNHHPIANCKIQQGTALVALVMWHHAVRVQVLLRYIRQSLVSSGLYQQQP